MKQIAPCMGSIVIAAAVFVSISQGDSPADTEIPIIGMIFEWWDWYPELLCQMEWKHFGGFEFVILNDQVQYISDLMATVDSCGLLVIINPADLGKLAIMGSDSCRGHYGSLSGDSAFISVNTSGSAITGVHSASGTESLIEDLCEDLVDTFDSFDQIWFFRYFDEPEANQRHNIYDTNREYDDYFPSYLTTDTTSFRADSAGTYSWIKWALAGEDQDLITCGVLAGAPRIFPGQPWAGFYHGPDVVNAHGRAEIVRGFCSMRYQPISGSVQDNLNDYVSVDIYPFRHIGTLYQDTASYTPAVCDSLHMWLLDHMETSMDSMFLAASENDSYLLYWPQLFGYAGGAALWTYDEEGGYWYIDYESYPYRIPTPAEARMLINLALLRQVKGMMPYCMTSYEGSSNENIPRYYTGLLDGNLIPFDAPFEEWAYSSRPQDSLSFIRPDSIEPFISGFDPLYSGPGTPPSNTGEERYREDFLEWKFAPYARLWNSLEDIFGDVAFTAPELADLCWYEGYEDAARIMCADDTLEYMTPEIRVFTNPSTYRSYIFYVNRNCREESDIFGIRINADSLSFPSWYALDHSRRVIITSQQVESQLFAYNDTLAAGEARLVELTPVSTDADMRVTAPDVFASIRGSETCTTEFEFTAEDSIEIYAAVYNLGTDTVSGVVVTLTDITSSTNFEIDRDTLSFHGLSLSGYVADCDTASFQWVPAVTGIRKLRVNVASISGEPDSRDNSVSIPFLIRPEDYATAVRDDAWDMTERGSDDWKTTDICDADGWTSYTDSISGMFEGVIIGDSSSTNRLYLDLDDTTDIDGDTYNQVSLVCVSPEVTCDVIIGWEDTAHGSGTITLSEDLPPGAWREIGPVDLSGSWSGKTIDMLWLRFSYVGNYNRPIRIGWVDLTE